MLIWNENYSVGIQSIDNQHKELFVLLNRLLESMKRGEGNSITHQIVFDLEKYAFAHFQREEFFFQKFQYEKSIVHIAEHQIFIQKISSLKSDLKSDKFILSLDLLNFLKNWIEHHILVVDKEYSECFRENGLK